MSLNQREIGQLVVVVRDAIALIDATTLTIGQLDENALTRNQLAVLVNRFYAEQEGQGTPAALAES